MGILTENSFFSGLSESEVIGIHDTKIEKENYYVKIHIIYVLRQVSNFCYLITYCILNMQVMAQ